MKTFKLFAILAVITMAYSCASSKEMQCEKEKAACCQTENKQ